MFDFWLWTIKGRPCLIFGFFTPVHFSCKRGHPMDTICHFLDEYKSFLLLQVMIQLLYHPLVQKKNHHVRSLNQEVRSYVQLKKWPSVKKWPHKRCGLSWGGHFSSNLLSQCMWNLALRDDLSLGNNFLVFFYDSASKAGRKRGWLLVREAL